jgi:DNA-binding Xre family transcriptional regulator
MKARRISAYALCKGTTLSYPSAYRLSRPGGRFGRLNADTLDRLCGFFKVQPGALIEWRADGQQSGPRRRRGVER